MPTKVCLWSAPRCVSTAFEFCIRQVKDSKVFHEPYYMSYYFGPERQSPRYLSHPVDLKASHEEIGKLLCQEYDGAELIFSKDMAFYMENNFEKLSCKTLKEFQHTFLIRNPTKAIPSLYRVAIDKELSGWGYFDPTEAGFRQLFDLYHYVKETFNVIPVVIDADDLLENPKETVKGALTIFFGSLL